MPLLVSCPCGKELRMPASRAGKIGRCPECKSRIRVPVPTADETAGEKSDAPIRLNAVLMKAAPIPTTPSETVSPPAGTGTKSDLKQKPTDKKDRKSKNGKKGKNGKRSTEVTPIYVPEYADPVVPADEVKPESVENDEAALQYDQELYYDAPGVELQLKGAGEQSEADSSSAEPASEEDQFDSSLLELGSNPQRQKEIQIQQRAKSAQDDRVVLARFFAICLCGIAIVNVIPAIYFWQQWNELPGGYAAGNRVPTLPRWMYLQIFIAAIHVMYAVFLAQIPDWASMRAVSIAMLVVAMVFGLISTGILMGGSEGAVAQFLVLGEASLTRQASIWCVAMLCLATLMSYLGGRESARWQRAEQLLGEIGTQ